MLSYNNFIIPTPGYNFNTKKSHILEFKADSMKCYSVTAKFLMDSLMYVSRNLKTIINSFLDKLCTYSKKLFGLKILKICHFLSKIKFSGL